MKILTLFNSIHYIFTREIPSQVFFLTVHVKMITSYYDGTSCTCIVCSIKDLKDPPPPKKKNKKKIQCFWHCIFHSWYFFFIFYLLFRTREVINSNPFLLMKQSPYSTSNHLIPLQILILSWTFAFYISVFTRWQCEPC